MINTEYRCPGCQGTTQDADTMRRHQEGCVAYLRGEVAALEEAAEANMTAAMREGEERTALRAELAAARARLGEVEAAAELAASVIAIWMVRSPGKRSMREVYATLRAALAPPEKETP